MFIFESYVNTRYKPKHYPEYVGNQQCEADIERKAFGVLSLLYCEVLWYVWQDTADDHGYMHMRGSR